MRYTDKMNDLIHPMMVKWLLKSYTKKMDRRFAARPDLNKPVDSALTKKHIELYRRLGLPCNDKWLRFYCNLTGVNDYTYMPEDLFFARIERVLNDCNRADSEGEDKNLLLNYVDRQYLPKTILRMVRGCYYDGDNNSFDKAYAEDILSTNNGPIIGKQASESSGGHGVKAFRFDKKLNKYVSSDNIVLTCSWIEEQSSNYLIQEQLRQCEFSAMFNPSSINTCRIITLRCPWNGKIKVVKAGMRLGVTNDICDNMGMGGVGLGISPTGELGPIAYTYNDLKEFKTHPVSMIPFENQRHPNFDKMCEVVVEQARRFPNYNMVSWDVITDSNNNVRIIEVNLTSQGTDFPQFAYGSLFGSDTEKIIDWVADHMQYDKFKHIRTFY